MLGVIISLFFLILGQKIEFCIKRVENFSTCSSNIKILRVIEGLDKDKRVYVEVERAKNITGLERLYRNNTRREIKRIPHEFNVGKSTVLA